MTKTHEPSRARDLVDQLEAEIVDLDALTAPEPHSALPSEDITAALPGTVEPPD